eukprot:TRINITY_DN14080_c0_g1_i1.p1 TRINITY_DN14080_c0_g1~~TRINITY_DN14080_c0_g1_i1.p1  ORF type:complete len:664 (+),score=100.91 TRINITY_DN14080_c0_g1_i1:78-1994(+)
MSAPVSRQPSAVSRQTSAARGHSANPEQHLSSTIASAPGLGNSLAQQPFTPAHPGVAGGPECQGFAESPPPGEEVDAELPDAPARPPPEGASAALEELRQRRAAGTQDGESDGGAPHEPPAKGDEDDEAEAVAAAMRLRSRDPRLRSASGSQPRSPAAEGRPAATDPWEQPQPRSPSGPQHPPEPPFDVPEPAPAPPPPPPPPPPPEALSRQSSSARRAHFADSLSPPPPPAHLETLAGQLAELTSAIAQLQRENSTLRAEKDQLRQAAAGRGGERPSTSPQPRRPQGQRRAGGKQSKRETPRRSGGRRSGSQQRGNRSPHNRASPPPAARPRRAPQPRPGAKSPGAGQRRRAPSPRTPASGLSADGAAEQARQLREEELQRRGRRSPGSGRKSFEVPRRVPPPPESTPLARSEGSLSPGREGRSQSPQRRRPTPSDPQRRVSPGAARCSASPGCRVRPATPPRQRPQTALAQRKALAASVQIRLGADTSVDTVTRLRQLKDLCAPGLIHCVRTGGTAGPPPRGRGQPCRAWQAPLPAGAGAQQGQYHARPHATAQHQPWAQPRPQGGSPPRPAPPGAQPYHHHHQHHHHQHQHHQQHHYQYHQQQPQPQNAGPCAAQPRGHSPPPQTVFSPQALAAL